jgi:hypothetical protein
LAAAGSASITGTVTDPRGAPVAGAAVMFTGASPSHRDVAAVTDAQGGFRFGGLPPGRYTVLVNATGFGPQQWPVTVEAGATARLDVVLGR